MKTTRKSERGIVHIIFIVVGLIVLGVVGYLGWKAFMTKTASNPSTTSNVVVDNTCINTYHDANLCHFASHSTSLDKVAYNATLKMTDNQG